MQALQLALLLTHTADPESLLPSISGLSISSTAGDVQAGTPATVIVQWINANVDDEIIKVYQDNLLVGTLGAGDQSYTHTVAGYAEANLGGTSFRTTMSWRFRVELQNSAGTLIKSLEGAFTGVYERLAVT